jgi:hypothetical protein
MQRYNSRIIGTIVSCIALMACGSDAGEPCQVQSDCSSGLLCCKTPGSGVATRGVCRASCPQPDAGVDVGPDVSEPEEDAALDGGQDATD